MIDVASREVLAKLSAGDQVYLKSDGNLLYVLNGAGERIGRVEPRLASRLLQFMQGGSQYAAGIAEMRDHTVRLIVREMFQDPKMFGRVSFPTQRGAGDTVRAYIKDTLPHATTATRRPRSLAEVRRLRRLLPAESRATRHQSGDAGVRRGQKRGLEDVVQRVDRAFQAFFRRVKAGETPGYPRFHGRNRYNSVHLSAGGRARRRATRTMASWSSPRSDALLVRWCRPHGGHAQDGHNQRGKRTAGTSASPVPRCRCSRCPPTDQETGIDLGLESFATLADGDAHPPPGCYRKAERRTQDARSAASPGARREYPPPQGGRTAG